MRRTKILATLGPASADPQLLDALIAAGLDAVRLNFSHGTRDWHATVHARVREAAARAGRPIAILQDLQGPKIRIGRVEGDGFDAPTGSTLVITTRKNVLGKEGIVSTEYAALSRDVAKGDLILLDEGRVEVVVTEVRGEDIICRVNDGGRLSSNKGINVPGATLTTAAMTEKDREDVRFGLELGVDFVALSFVRRAKDVEDLRAVIRASGKQAAIVAKIEKPQAIDNLDEIIAAADGLMVARGDLGIEVPLEMVPVHQKRIIERSNRAGKLVITATQMLESMTDNPFPTRAEVTDVANAILDGTDAIMLSGETAVGKFPVETVRRMASIAETAEEQLYPFNRALRSEEPPGEHDFTLAAARMAAHASQEIEAKAIAVFTKSGRTARCVSDERPRSSIVAFTTEPTSLGQLALYWGVVPRAIEEKQSPSDLLALGEREIVAAGLATRGDRLVFIFGTSTAEGATNSVQLSKIGGD